MKYYKDFGKTYIGTSDIACLTYRTMTTEDIKLGVIEFGQDASYEAYIVDQDTEIPEHYDLIVEGLNWLHIIDDSEVTKKFRAEKIKIYRASQMGCIIQLINEDN